MSVISETLKYEADGLQMESPLFFDDTAPGPRPGILLFPDVFGVGSHVRERAERLASLGYCALACDLHGGGQRIEDVQRVNELMGPVREDAGRLRARGIGALDALASHDSVDASRIVATGYCIGGTFALELARSGADIAGVVGFHSGLQTPRPQNASAIKGKILVCIGADDPMIPPAQRADFEAEMRAGGVDWRMHLYGGTVHSFTNVHADAMGRPEMARYSPGADVRSWAEQLAFLEELFGKPG
ncbi:dienelactone hydrolase family protein [Croceicoccus bisphenolivorans]|uniref:dienelactone hydrolase family protein n=1 Tax=Croceicoccus bisphenolivorans TaxID=1783232 RepID=UPI0008375D82|nr:dienelactone hydrolase family protein [Croceicoccus bisphenolivorans]